MEKIKQSKSLNQIQFNYKNGILNNIDTLQLPSRNWVAVKSPNKEMMFIRVEEDHSTYLAVCFDLELNVKIYYHSALMKWIKFDNPTRKEEMEQILNIVHNIIVSGKMYIQNIECL